MVFTMKHIDLFKSIGARQTAKHSGFKISGKALLLVSSIAGSSSLLISGYAAAAAPLADGDNSYHTTFEVSASPELAQSVPANVRKAGYIIIGTNPNTPPTTYLAEDNKTLEGREIDIMSAVAHRLGLTPRWRKTGGFDNIIPGLATGRYDAAISNINGSAERNKHVDFVSYYNSSRIAMISRIVPGQKSPAQITDLNELCGKTIGAGAGTGNLLTLETQSAKCTANGKPAIEIPIFPNRPAGVQAVATGRVPYFLGPYDGVSYMVRVSKDTLNLSGVFTLPIRHTSIALQKNSTLTQPVKAAVNSLIADGTYQKILDKWGLGYGAVTESLANAEIRDGE